jgi:acetylornithine/N-succinyldiaminopimelate aminotransferase
VRMGDFIRAELAQRLAGAKGVKEIRGKGLMIGVELDYACGDLTQQALEQGLLVNVTADNVIRLLPPLTLKRDEAEQLIATLAPLVTEFLARQSARQAATQTA